MSVKKECMITEDGRSINLNSKNIVNTASACLKDAGSVADEIGSTQQEHYNASTEEQHKLQTGISPLATSKTAVTLFESAANVDEKVHNSNAFLKCEEKEHSEKLVGQLVLGKSELNLSNGGDAKGEQLVASPLVDAERFTCRDCGKTYARRHSLTVHMCVHTGERPFKCETCGKTFARSNNLKAHMRTHVGVKPYKCNSCDNAYFRKWDLEQHANIHTIGKQFSCTTCEKRFLYKAHLKSHMRSHSGTKPFTCEICGNSFTCRTSLNVHHLVHTDEKSFKCTSCEKSFATMAKLTCHMRTHTGVKPYKCTTCGHAFFQRGNLTVHERKHTGEKPYKCYICGRAFSLRSTVKKHMKIHLKPFECKYCSETGFLSRTELVGHIRSHTGKSLHTCDFCEKQFIQKSSLNRHMHIHVD